MLKFKTGDEIQVVDSSFGYSSFEELAKERGLVDFIKGAQVLNGLFGTVNSVPAGGGEGHRRVFGIRVCGQDYLVGEDGLKLVEKKETARIEVGTRLVLDTGFDHNLKNFTEGKVYVCGRVVEHGCLTKIYCISDTGMEDFGYSYYFLRAAEDPYSERKMVVGSDFTLVSNNDKIFSCIRVEKSVVCSGSRIFYLDTDGLETWAWERYTSLVEEEDPPKPEVDEGADLIGKVVTLDTESCPFKFISYCSLTKRMNMESVSDPNRAYHHFIPFVRKRLEVGAWKLVEEDPEPIEDEGSDLIGQVFNNLVGISYRFNAYNPETKKLRCLNITNSSFPLYPTVKRAREHLKKGEWEIQTDADLIGIIYKMRDLEEFYKIVRLADNKGYVVIESHPDPKIVIKTISISFARERIADGDWEITDSQDLGADLIGKTVNMRSENSPFTFVSYDDGTRRIMLESNSDSKRAYHHFLPFVRKQIEDGTWTLVEEKEEPLVEIGVGDYFQKNYSTDQVYECIRRDNSTGVRYIKLYYLSDDENTYWCFEHNCTLVEEKEEVELKAYTSQFPEPNQTVTKFFEFHDKERPEAWQKYNPQTEEYSTSEVTGDDYNKYLKQQPIEEINMVYLKDKKEKESKMKNTTTINIDVSNKAFDKKEITTLYGRDLNDMNEAHLFDVLRRIKADQDTLEGLETGDMSKRISAKIKALKTSRGKVIALIDLIED